MFHIYFMLNGKKYADPTPMTLCEARREARLLNTNPEEEFHWFVEPIPA